MASKATFLRDVIEPAFIVLAFTFGALINRRRPVSKDDVERCTSQMQEASPPPLQPASGDNPASRFIRTFPFLIEIWYWNLTYWVYQGLRAVSARLISGNEAIFARAQSHALAILRLEQRLGIFVERYVQQYILSNMPWLMPILAKVYYSHISLGICFIIYCYTCLPPSTFRRIRRTIAADNGIAFIIITLWRCMPPRLLPPEYGFVDVLHGAQGGGNSWTNNRFQLTIAAMPSLHFGTALFIAWCTCRFSPHRWLRYLAPLWPAAMLLTIVATANHFLLDAMIGAMVPVIGWRLNRIMLTFKPLEDWLFATLRMEAFDPSHKPILRGT